MANLGSTKIFVDKSKWSNKTSRMIGRTAEALSVNASIDALTTTLMQIYRKYETSESLSLDLIRSVFLGTDKEFTTFLPVFDKYIDSITQQVGKTLTKGTFYKYQGGEAELSKLPTGKISPQGHWVVRTNKCCCPRL